MIRRRQRQGLRPARLTRGDRDVLRFGHTLGEPSDLYYRGPYGWWVYALVAAEATWRRHRDELLEEAARDGGCIPWAAREFEDMPGAIHPHEHLRETMAAEAEGSAGDDDDAGRAA